VLEILLRPVSESVGSIFSTLIAKDTRPVFPYDLDENARYVYEAIKLWDFPSDVQNHSGFVYLRWRETSLNLSLVVKTLSDLELCVMLAHEVSDYALSDDDEYGDSEFDAADGQYYYFDSDVLKQLNKSDAITVLSSTVNDVSALKFEALFPLLAKSLYGLRL
jgi:hypothetical protein